MLYNSLLERLNPTPTGSLSSLSAQQTVQFRIKQEARRLEALIITLAATTGASAANNHDGLAGLVKEIRLNATDVLGQRNIIQVTGPACLSFVRNNFGSLDRSSFASYRAASLPSSTPLSVSMFVPVRHPLVAEPYGHLLSLPLGSNFLKGDPVLEVDVNPASAVFSAGAPTSATIKAYALMRNVPDSVPYIPTELVTKEFKPGATGKQSFDLDSVGFLTQILVQGYSANAYGNTIQRVDLLSTSPVGELNFMLGRNRLLNLDADTCYALNDLTQHLQGNVSTDTLIKPQTFIGEMFLDFISDYPDADAFSAASAINLNTDALGGDKARLEWDQWANSSYMARITIHKLLARTRDALKPLSVAI